MDEIITAVKDLWTMSLPIGPLLVLFVGFLLGYAKAKEDKKKLEEELRTARSSFEAARAMLDMARETFRAIAPMVSCEESIVIREHHWPVGVQVVHGFMAHAKALGLTLPEWSPGKYPL